MRLIYAYALNYRNFKNQAFTLTNTYHVQMMGECGEWSGIRIIKVDAFQQKMPPNILSISALVGRNATGKTNFVDMISAKYRLSGHDGGGGEEAYFLLYAPNSNEGSLYYFEVVSPPKFKSLFPWLRTDKNSSCAAGWCRYDSAGECLWAAEPGVPAEGKTVMVSLRDSFQNDGLTRKHEFPVRRDDREYKAKTFDSQVRVVRKICRNEERAVLHDREYKLELIYNTEYLAHGPKGTPYRDMPLFPTLYDKEEVPEEARGAVHIAESWVKFLAGNKLGSLKDFDTWRSLRRVVMAQFDAQRPPRIVKDSNQIRRLLGRCQMTVIRFLNEEALLPGDWEEIDHQEEAFLEQLFKCSALEHKESSMVIPVVSADCANDEIERTVRVLIDDTFRRHQWVDEFFRPVWVNISDGELWYIHFLASVSEALDTAGGGDQEDTCILVLDEPEIHMHPDLARRLLDNLTRWLSDYTDKNVQIILTTHSPFVLSDIEKGNVQVLKREKGEIEVKEPKNQTYAANIYAILTDSFFLDSGFGEMARNQIKLVLDELNPENPENIDDGRRDDIIAVIHSVGERLVRRKLEELYQIKYGAYPDHGQREVRE